MSKAKLVKVFKMGKTQVNVIQGEYNGNPTYSFTLQKNTYNKETKEHGKSDFFNPTDLRDIQIALNRVLSNSVKEDVIKAKEQPEPEPEIESGGDEEVPF